MKKIFLTVCATILAVILYGASGKFGRDISHKVIDESVQLGIQKKYEDPEFRSFVVTTAANAANKAVPLKLEDGTIVTGVKTDGIATIFYENKIEISAQELKDRFSERRVQMERDIKDHWCSEPSAVDIRGVGAEIVYQYYSNDMTHIGDITVKTKYCFKDNLIEN